MRALALASIAVAIPALYFTYARGAIIGLIGGTIIWFAISRPKTAIVAAITVLLLITFAAPATIKARFNPADSGPDVVLRSDIWKSAVDIYQEYPVLGVGVNNFPVAYEQLPSTVDQGTQRRLLHDDLLLIPPHPQSMYLQALAEQGIVGFVALLTVIGSGLVLLLRATRSADRFTRTLGYGVGIGFGEILIHGFLEVPLMGEAIMPLFTLFAVTAIAVERSRAEEPAEAGAARPAGALSEPAAA
jgi:O-antigen ligase